MKIQKYVDKKNNNLYNKNHINELPLYHDKAIEAKPAYAGRITKEL